MGRLNAPDGSYGVLYAAAAREGAFAETFLRSPGRTLLAGDFIARKAYVRLRIMRELRLVQLHGNGLARIGATAEVTHGGLPYDAPQAWSAAIHAHPGQFDGIAYRARHDDGQIAYALFDRASNAVQVAARTANLQTSWFFGLLDHYGVGLAP
ncbi:RES family NAD+ phosphorylase [Jiella sp. KSK16Y-1]|uniref:RES family NAD+ phosphorylase n=2 Tax=Jiella mangrovi TaxID=2821407 RepID=A0ABS4BLZ6_9HYPH|nr:RES family NAD+ phosphorylase [Jiella mangrovi]